MYQKYLYTFDTYFMDYDITKIGNEHDNKVDASEAFLRSPETISMKFYVTHWLKSDLLYEDKIGVYEQQI